MNGADGEHRDGAVRTHGERGSSSLATLARLIDTSVDREYQEAVDRKRGIAAGAGPRRETEPPARRTPAPRSVSFLLVALMAGLLLTIAVLHVHDRAPAVARAHAALVDRIHNVTADNDALEKTADDLRGRVISARDSSLSATTLGSQLAVRLRQLALATGGIAVVGPGVTVTLDDAPGASTAKGDNLGLIYDRDLQAVVNALWAAGADAIAINGQRLTAQTAIRSAGEAILVDFRPLTRPYVVAAVGGDRLEPTFADSATGRLYRSWKQIYGLGFNVKAASSLTLPAAATVSLRYARVPAPSEAPEQNRDQP